MSEQLYEQANKRRGWLSTRWLRFTLAVTFLTRLPLPIKGAVTPEDMRASMAWYPLIGLALGTLGFGGYVAGCKVFSNLLAAALVIVLLEACTGVLHLDGFMDTCDGLGSGKPRERMLEIMKDSRVGAMGVFGAIAVILIKVTALASLSPAQSFVPLLAGWMAARAVPVFNVTLFPYARTSGTGGLFTGGSTGWIQLFAILCLAVLTPGGLIGAFLVWGIIIAVLLVQAVIARKLGGLTGDVYGFGIELAELLTLVAGSALAACEFI